MTNLYLIPISLGENAAPSYIPACTAEVIPTVTTIFAEGAKSARGFIGSLKLGKALKDYQIQELPSDLTLDAAHKLLRAHNGPWAIVSEAGAPCIADPGALLVLAAHEQSHRVVPLAGPSAIMLALMASGLNGQDFRFRGYLPVDAPARTQTIRELERAASTTTQIMIETPYRAEALLQILLQTLQPRTLLSVACDITTPNEFIATRSVEQWRNKPCTLAKRPTTFLVGVRP